MLGSLGAPELLIIGAVVILIFGVGKLSGLGRDLGNSIKEFRRAVKDEEPEQPAPQQHHAQAAPPPPQQQYTPPPPPKSPAGTSGDQGNSNIF